jgi:hypothetical protein
VPRVARQSVPVASVSEPPPVPRAARPSAPVPFASDPPTAPPIEAEPAMPAPFAAEPLPPAPFAAQPLPPPPRPQGSPEPPPAPFAMGQQPAHAFGSDAPFDPGAMGEQPVHAFGSDAPFDPGAMAGQPTHAFGSEAPVGPGATAQPAPFGAEPMPPGGFADDPAAGGFQPELAPAESHFAPNPFGEAPPAPPESGYGPPSPPWFDPELERKLRKPFARRDLDAPAEADAEQHQPAEPPREESFYASEEQIDQAVENALGDATIEQPRSAEATRRAGSPDRIVSPISPIRPIAPEAPAPADDRSIGDETAADHVFGQPPPHAPPGAGFGDQPYHSAAQPPFADQGFGQPGFHDHRFDPGAAGDQGNTFQGYGQQGFAEPGAGQVEHRPHADPLFADPSLGELYGTDGAAEPAQWEPVFGEQVVGEAHEPGDRSGEHHAVHPPAAHPHPDYHAAHAAHGERSHGEPSTEPFQPPHYAPEGYPPPPFAQQHAPPGFAPQPPHPDFTPQPRHPEPLLERPQIDRAQFEQLHFEPSADEALDGHGAPLHLDDEALRPAPAVWKQAHPSARRWADRRQRVHGLGRAPSPPRIAAGLLLAGLGAWFLLSFLPGRKPLNEVERARVSRQAGVDEHAWRFPPPLHRAAQGAAALYVSLGFLIAVRGLFFRRRIEVSCRRCQRVVMAERTTVALRCESGRHSAGTNWGAVMLLLAVFAVTTALVALVVMAQLKIDFGLGLDFG